MASPNHISVVQLNELLGTHNAPILVGVRDDQNFASDPQYIPTAIRCSHLAAESQGLLAASLGLSRMFSDDREQLDAGCLLYDAFYRRCCDATDETHDWPGQVTKT